MESAHDKTGLIRKVAKHSHTHTWHVERLSWSCSGGSLRTYGEEVELLFHPLDQHGPGVRWRNKL